MFKKITESESNYRHLDKMTVTELLTHINEEDQKVPLAVSKVIPQIENLVRAIVDKMLAGGRLFYIGAGTSGRLGIVDASECPPTFGIPYGLVIGIIAGGQRAITEAVEYAEDDKLRGWEDLQSYNINTEDVVIGIAASGTTPYVINALQMCRKHSVVTGSIACNPSSPLSSEADYPVEIIVGPEFITGSTRMKSGTAQKLALNMISTSVMIQLGRVEDNRMVNMQLTNEKLIERGVNMIISAIGDIDYDSARALLVSYGTVKNAINGYQK